MSTISIDNHADSRFTGSKHPSVHRMGDSFRMNGENGKCDRLFGSYIEMNGIELVVSFYAMAYFLIFVWFRGFKDWLFGKGEILGLFLIFLQKSVHTLKSASLLSFWSLLLIVVYFIFILVVFSFVSIGQCL